MDVEVVNHGTVILFVGQSDEGRSWIAQNVEAEAWQWLGPDLAVDHRLAGGLIDGMVDDGLNVSCGRN